MIAPNTTTQRLIKICRESMRLHALIYRTTLRDGNNLHLAFEHLKDAKRLRDMSHRWAVSSDV